MQPGETKKNIGTLIILFIWLFGLWMASHTDMRGLDDCPKKWQELCIDLP